MLYPIIGHPYRVEYISDTYVLFFQINNPTFEIYMTLNVDTFPIIEHDICFSVQTTNRFIFNKVQSAILLLFLKSDRSKIRLPVLFTSFEVEDQITLNLVRKTKTNLSMTIDVNSQRFHYRDFVRSELIQLLESNLPDLGGFEFQPKLENQLTHYLKVL